MWLARRLKYRCTKMSFPLVLPHLSVLFSRHACKESKENIALTQEQLLTPPDSAPTLRIDPYPNLPFLDQNDETCSVKVGSAAPTSGLCEVCQKSVPLHSMRTHIGRHVLLRECARDVCGYCGGHDCTTQLLRNTQGRLVSVIVTNCPLEPTNVRYGAMARGSARNPCTNRPMQCVLCRDTVWLYGMAHHFDSKHAGSAPPPQHMIPIAHQVKVSYLNEGLFLCPCLPEPPPPPTPVRSMRRKCSKEPLLVLGPSLC